VIQNADPGVVEELKFGIRHLLGSDYLRLDKRRELEAALLTRIRATGETLSIDAPLYKQQKEALVSIRKILEIEA
jgi:hypothetical protein